MSSSSSSSSSPLQGEQQQQQQQPTIVTLPPPPLRHQQTQQRPNSNNNNDDMFVVENHHVFPDVASPLIDDGGLASISTTTPITTTTIVMQDTSRDAEIAAALAAEDEQEGDWMNHTQSTKVASSEVVRGGDTVGPGITGPTLIHQHPNGITTTNDGNTMTTTPYTVATVSAPWQYDDHHNTCYNCQVEFHPIFNRKHHCRYCGYIFCHNCTKTKLLLPPSQIVLHPITGKQTKPPSLYEPENTIAHVSFTPNPDPDRMLTYIASGNTMNNTTNNNSNELLYGRGLEERFQLAREPLRVCQRCYNQVQHLQEELRYHNSNAMRYNAIDPTNIQRMFNSPFANTLGHEIRKAAYALNNLLPQPKRRMGAVVDMMDGGNMNPIHTDIQHCKDTCTTISPNLNDIDGVQIPARLLEMAKGVAILTVIKGGFGFIGGEFGTGLVVARLPNNNINNNNNINPTNEGGSSNNSFRWSAPSAIGTAGVSWGALLGAQVSDHVFLLMSDEAVSLLYNNKASIQLGADVGIAIGPVGRTLEGDFGVDGKLNAPIYTYSMSKGLYAGISLDGKVIVSRPDVNEKFYGMSITAEEILAGVVPTPPAAQPLYEALHRCHVYATMSETKTNRILQSQQQQQRPTDRSNDPYAQIQYIPTMTRNVDESSYRQEYGEQI